MSEEEFKLTHHIGEKIPLKITPELMTIMGIPTSLWMATKSKLQPNVKKKYNELFEKFDNKKASFLIFHGKEKTGKSSILSVIGKSVKAYYKSVFYVTVPDLKELVYAKKLYDGNTPYYDRCIISDCLLLDNFGEEYFNEMFSEKLSSIIRNRMENNKLTIICSEYNKDDLIKAYDKNKILVKYLNRFEYVQLLKGGN